MAADLGHLRVSERDAVSSITGANNELDFFLLYIGAAQRLFKCLLSSGNHIGAGVNEGVAHDLFTLINHDRFGLCRSDVNSGGVRHT